jgi:hypothetical protein
MNFMHLRQHSGPSFERFERLLDKTLSKSDDLKAPAERCDPQVEEICQRRL